MTVRGTVIGPSIGSNEMKCIALWIGFICVCGFGLIVERLGYVFLTSHSVHLPAMLLLLIVELLLGIAVFCCSSRRIVAASGIFLGLVTGNWWLLELLLAGTIWRTRGFAP